MPQNAAPQPGDTYLQFDGLSSYAEIPSIAAYSVANTGELTVSAWMRPDVLEFPHAEGTNYVHWMGKGNSYGATGDQEWTCRMYSFTTTDSPPRPNRTSSYFQGGLSRVRIWGRALGAAEIAGLFAVDTVPRDKLVAEFLLNADTGAAAIDTALGNNGTINGASWATLA
ncbi:MAG: hypothetical protein ACHRXM_28815 [Isosphaerales bacterium]